MGSKPCFHWRALWCSWLLLLLPLPTWGWQADALEREWRVRNLALEETWDGAAIGVQVQAPDWRQRVGGWEALERALFVGRRLPEALLLPLQKALQASHPGERLAALECVGQLDRGFVLDANLAQVLAQEAWPDLRMALAQALERVSCEIVGRLSLELRSDSDERVAMLASRLFWGLPTGRDNTENKRSEFCSIAAAMEKDGPRHAREALANIWQGPPDKALQIYLRNSVLRAEIASRKALLAVIGAMERAQGCDRYIGSMDHLKEGWDSAIGADFVPRGLLLAASRSGDIQLAEFWMQVLDAVSREEVAQLPWESLRITTRGRFDPEGGMLRAIIQCVGPRVALRMALDSELQPSVCAELLTEVGSEVSAWNWLVEHQGASAWLGSDTPLELQESLVRALAGTLFRNGDSGAGKLLVGFLKSSDADLHELAFQALANDLREGDWQLPLYGDWASLDLVTKRRCAAWLPRGKRLEAFRDELMDWGSRLPERSQAVELLAAFEGDGTVLACLSGWLEGDFDRISQLGPEVLPRERRDLERLVQTELRCLAELAGEGPGLEELERVLLASRGLSEPVGKTAAIQLGRTVQGRQRLAGLLDRGLDVRPRVEACMLLLKHSQAPAEALLASQLIEDFASVEVQVRVSLISALGNARSPEALRFLTQLASESGDFSERVAALEALARVPGPAAEESGSGRAYLRQVIVEQPEVEYRRVAVQALAREGDFQDLVWLVEDVLLAPSSASKPSLASAERELLHAELMAHCGAAFRRYRTKDYSLGPMDRQRLEDLGQRLAEELLKRPMAQAESRLQASFEGREIGALEFEWRGEIALARQLGQAGLLGAALEAWPDWQRLDGELLLALAKSPGASDDLRAMLLGAGLVALHPARSLGSKKARATARFDLLQLAWDGARWGQAARLAAGLRADQRTGQIPRAAWTRALGLFDRHAGVDPEARLHSLALLAQGHQGLALGQLEAAEEQLRKARGHVGQSSWAKAACEKLASALQER